MADMTISSRLNRICPFKNLPPITEIQLKKQLQWLLLLRVLILTMLLGISAILHSLNQDLLIPPLRYLIYLIGGIYLFTITSALALKFTTYLKQFAILQILLDSLLVAGLVYYTGGSQSIFGMMNFLPIIAGSILLFLPGGLFIAAVTTFNNGIILLLEFKGYYPLFSPKSDFSLSSIEALLHYFSISGITYFLVALLTSLLAARLQQTEVELNRTSQDLDRLSILYKQIFADITTGIITVHSDGEITSFNRAAEKITGFSAHEILGQAINRKLPDLEKSKQDTLRPITNLTRKDGRIIPVGFSWTKLNLPGDCQNCRVYTMQDLSKIKKMEDRVRQSEKMAAIGRMAAGIAHEFRNPLAAISGAAQVLVQDMAEEAPSRGLMNIILRESDRLEGTISEFLQFSKPAAPEKSWFSMAGLVEETIEIIKQAPKMNSKIQFVSRITPQLDCWADPGQMKQILLNLLNNAANAIDKNNGIISITASEQLGRKGKDWTVIKIADTGPGITDKIINKIFEPFFTTRENGTGLGLAIVRQLIESHGGLIEAKKNNEDHGAVFIIHLPLP